MRKFLGIGAIVLASLAASAPALAQDDAPVRDPFVPLVQPSPVATGTDPTVPVDPAAPVDPAPDPNEPLPGTGSSAATWFGLGYVLVALGAGAVAVAKLFAPLRVASR